MKKKIIGVVILASMAFTTGWNFNQTKKEMSLSALMLANVEALAQKEDGSGQTWQIGEKTIVSTTSPGWTYNAQLKVWLFNGQVTASSPPSTETLKIKCCRLQGPESSCSYEEC